ncbi:MAG: trypsin-like peptidase domain-containing protein [Isosphaeraceae bacterium]
MKRNAVSWVALVVSAAALVSARGVSRPLPAALTIPVESQKTVRALSEAFEAVAEYTKPSVVQISVERKAGAGPNLRGRRGPIPNVPRNLDPQELEEMLRRFFGPNGRPLPQQFGPIPGEGTGSGFVYDDKGHIVTNNHVVENAGKIKVTFYDGNEYTAEVVGTDPQTDVAVIKVDSTDYRPLVRGQSGKLKVGEWVMAIGSPFGLSHTVTSGIISATDRNTLNINEFEAFVQTDAAINPGNSGGPLVNMEGMVIGVNSAILTSNRGNDGVGLAIPIDLAGNVADSLIKFGKVKRSRVGIALAPVTPALARQLGLPENTKGIMADQILPGSPADKAGLKSGDVITGFNGNPVSSIPSFRLTVSTSESGREFSVTYWRDGKERTTEIVPAPYEEVRFEQDRPLRDEEEKVQPKDDEPKVELDDFGLEVQELTAELGKQFGHDPDKKGLLVSEVKAGSVAEAAGIEPGMVISQIVKDRKIQPLTSIKEFEAMTKGAAEIAVRVESPNGTGRFVTLGKPD